MTRRTIILYRFAAVLCLIGAAFVFAAHSRGASACCLRTLGFGYGDSMYNYDFENQSVDASHVDWAASLIFYGGANINYVKGIDTNYWTSGSKENFYLNDTGSWTWDQDGGMKTDTGSCLGSSRHYRVYAPSGTDRMYNPSFNYYIFGSTHYDHHELCSDAWFDDSEGTEANIWGWFQNHIYYARYDYAWWYNGQSGNQGNHHWNNDGYATYISV